MSLTLSIFLFLVVVGHFIVVCGYNKKDQLIFYKNPAYRKQGRNIYELKQLVIFIKILDVIVFDMFIFFFSSII